MDDVAEIKKIGEALLRLVTKLVGAIAKEIVPDLLKGSKVGYDFSIITNFYAIIFQ